MSNSNVTCSFCKKEHSRDGNAGGRGRGRRTRTPSRRSRGQGAGGRVQIERALSALKRKSEALTVAIGVQKGLLDAGVKELKGILASCIEVKEEITAERAGVAVVKAILDSVGFWDLPHYWKVE